MMNPIRSQRLKQYGVPTTAPTWLALPAAAWIHHALLFTPPGRVTHSVNLAGNATHFAMAAAMLLGIACVAVMAVQARQPRLNRTPLMPGLVLLYAAWVVAQALHAPNLPRSFWAYTPDAMRFFGIAFDYALPVIGTTMAAVALLMLLLRRPVTLQAWGYGQLYRADPELIERCRPVRAGAQVATPTPVQPRTPADAPPAERTFQYPARKPRTSFGDLHGNGELKERLREAGSAWRNDGKNGVLLFGPPGTGKTVFAEALAGEFGLAFMKVTFGHLASKWINQSTEQLVRAFDEARAQQPVMLFIDELDALLKSRDASGSYEEYQRLVTTFLDKAVDARGSQVLLAAATNYVDRLDDAAIREGRFDFKIQVPLPDAAARRGLLAACLQRFHCSADADTMARLTRRWGGFNVPRLLACGDGACELARADAGRDPKPARSEPETPVVVGYDHFYRALRKIQGRKGGAPEGSKRLADLFLDAEPAERLATLATQLVDVDKIERLGGSLPKGVLFFGPPGTGKTATAMALARECGWSFISRTGRELLADGAIDRLGKEASDLRPAIVFIDEADDILGDRRGSPFKSATNELLILIDGAEGMLCDVVWVAATNHPDNMDAAATRGGRFGQKIEFAAPGEATALRMIVDWANRKQAANALEIDGAPEAWAAVVYPAARGLTPSDVYQVLESANNTAITDNVRKQTPRAITLRHIEAAIAELRG